MYLIFQEHRIIYFNHQGADNNFPILLHRATIVAVAEPMFEWVQRNTDVSRGQPRPRATPAAAMPQRSAAISPPPSFTGKQHFFLQ